MFQQGKFDEAIEVAMVQPDPDDWPVRLPPVYVRSRSVVGSILLALGNFERAEEILRDSLDASQAHLGPDHAATLEAQFRLIRAMLSRDDSAKQAQARKMMTNLLPIVRNLAKTGRESLGYAYAFIIGNLESPTGDDVELALSVNQQLLQQPLSMNRRLRNLYAGALVKKHAGNLAGAETFLREIIESPAAYTWAAYSDSPFFVLRNTEDVLAYMLLESGDKARAEQVYRDAITRRETAKRPDQYQIIFAKQRLARFLREQGNDAEATELLAAENDALADAPRCFEWLRERIHEDLRAAEE